MPDNFLKVISPFLTSYVSDLLFSPGIWRNSDCIPVVSTVIPHHATIICNYALYFPYYKLKLKVYLMEQEMM